MADNTQQAQQEFNELVKGLSPEDVQLTKQTMVEMQKQLVLHEPWTIAHWDKDKRNEFLKQYTQEERKLMAKRAELEKQRRKEKKKGFGNG